MSGERSRWQTIKTRVLPFVFLGVLVLLAGRTCMAESAEVELSVDFGDVAAEVTHVAVDLYRGDDVAPVAAFEGRYEAGRSASRMRWPLHLDAGDYRAVIHVTLRDGARRIERRVHLAGSGSVRIPIGEELAAPP